MRTVMLVAGNLAATVLANVLLKLSADAGLFWPFALLQAGGNLVGLGGVLIYTALLRRLPLHAAYPLTQGLAVVLVQVLAAWLLFHEAVPPAHVAGSALVVAGIVLVGFSATAARGAGGSPC